MEHSGRSPLTLVVASVSSAAAAVVVRELWAPGTIASAALTPSLIALFAELLHRLEHLEENVGAARIELSADEVAELEALEAGEG